VTTTCPTLILCLGNEIVSDDGFGAKVAERLAVDAEIKSSAEVIFAPVAGFELLDLLSGRHRVLIVDTIQTGESPVGTLQRYEANHFTPGRHLTTSHQISLPTALELGARIGLDMPKKIDIITVEAGDIETLREGLTPLVEAAVEPAVGMVKDWVSNSTGH